MSFGGHCIIELLVTLLIEIPLYRVYPNSTDKLSGQILRNKVIVYFSYLWNFRVFSGQTPLGHPPTSFPTTKTFCKCPCFSLLLYMFQGRVKVASMSSITKGQGKFICRRFEWWETETM
jgi:hypothetical protein